MRMRASADGWRGIIGEGFTPESAGTLAARVVHTVGEPRVLVTYDGREFGAAAADAAVSAASASGASHVRLVPHLPTPTAAAAVRMGAADLAILITASHNPACWNGVKVKVRPGCPPSRELERAVDTAEDRWTGGATASQIQPEPASALVRDHIADVLGSAPGIATRRLRVVVDGLGGIAGEPVARLCRELNWEVDGLGCRPESDFGNLVPDPALVDSRSRAAQRVRGTEADLGVVLDGDGDRIFVLDHLGRTVQPAELLGLLLEHRHRRSIDVPGAGLAVTVATGGAARRVAEWLGRPVTELAVGFKHLSPLLTSGVVDAAGGGVGDVCFVEYGIDRDPFATLVLVADLVQDTGVGIAELLDDLRARVGPLHWFESKVDGTAGGEVLRAAGHLALREMGLDDSVSAVTEVDGIKFWLPDGQWVLLRASSTESGVRICGEFVARTDDHDWVAKLLAAVRSGMRFQDM